MNTSKDELKLTLDLAERVRDLRLEQGWTRRELADRIDATVMYVHWLENGHVSPAVRMLEKLASAFGVELRVELG